MSLRLESDGGSAPAESSDPRAASIELVLTGYRNDLAWRRVHDFVRREAERSGSSPLEEELPIPCLLWSGSDEKEAQRLVERLTGLGAVVRLDRPQDVVEEAPSEREPGFPLDPAAEVKGPPWYRDPFTVRLVVMASIIAVVGSQLGRLFVEKREEVRVSARKDAETIALAAKQEEADREMGRQVQRKIHRMRLDHRFRGMVARGEFVEAIEHIEKAAVKDPKIDAQRERVYERWARRRLLDGRPSEALKVLQEAIAWKETPALRALQGEVHAEMTNWTGAEDSYHRAVEIGGEDPDVYLALAGLYRQQGRQRDAVEMLNRAREYGARGRDLDALAHVIVAEQDAETGFDSLSNPNFTISFEQGEDLDAAQLVLSHLDAAYTTVGHKLGYWPEQKTSVVLYTAEDFQRVTHAPSWAGALYDGRIKIPIGGLERGNPDLAGTIRHEYAHVLTVQMTAGRCPVWLHEGVAMWVEEEQEGEREAWAVATTRAAGAPTLSRLGKSFTRLSAQRAMGAYAKSYLLVRLIVGRYGRLGLQSLLSAFASTDSVKKAFLEGLALDLASLETEIEERMNLMH